MNEAQLLPTLSSPAFFPGLEREEINRILLDELQGVTDKTILPPLQQFITVNMKGAALISATKDPGVNTAGAREELMKILRIILDSKEGREALIPALTLFQSPLLGMYVPQITARQKYISFEIRMVQRFKEVQDNVIDYIRLTLLLRPIVLTFMANTGELTNGCITSGYAKRIVETLEKKCPNLPRVIIESIVFSNISFQDDRDIPATSRLAAIFTHRAVNWNPRMKIDRGAESSDKSWFNIARKNYRFYGYDMDMLMELYNIAAELGW